MDIESFPGFCAAKVIMDLSSWDSPEEAMQEFCSQHQEGGSYYRTGKLLDPGAFVLFSGVEDINYKVNWNNPKYGDKTPDPDCLQGYGQEFANYIKRNKLGTVKQSSLRANRLNHPDHIDRLWIWCPNYTALKKWWKEHKDV